VALAVAMDHPAPAVLAEEETLELLARPTPAAVAGLLLVSPSLAMAALV
jgi:hypothetical protein